MRTGRAPRRGRIRPRLAVTAAAVTTAVVLAFCIPLAFYVRNVAYDRAIDSAELEARSLAAALDGVNGTNAVARLLRGADAAAATPALVVLSSGQVMGGVVQASRRRSPARPPRSPGDGGRAGRRPPAMGTRPG